MTTEQIEERNRQIENQIIASLPERKNAPSEYEIEIMNRILAKML